jgi:hypothetical protein
MTAVSNMEDVKAEINEFRDTMKKLFTCFDPGELEESYLEHHAARAAGKGQDFVELKVLKQKIKFPVNEIQQIENDIKSQIYARDFMLIDQSDMIISFIPAMADGRAAISSGVERELQHAHEAAKDVYVIWKAKQRPSVFVTQTATRMFTDLAAAVEFFDK